MGHPTENLGKSRAEKNAKNGTRSFKGNRDPIVLGGIHVVLCQRIQLHSASVPRELESG